MQYTISAATFLALVSAARAQTAGFDAITAPAKAEVVPACSNYVLTWDYVSTYAGTVTIQLLEGATSTTLQLGPVIASMYLSLSVCAPLLLGNLTNIPLQPASTTLSPHTPGLSTAPSATTPPTASRSSTTTMPPA